MRAITVGLRETNVLTRWRCVICGGSTDKEAVLAEYVDEDDDRHQVCGRCLQAPEETGDRLIAQAEGLEAWASHLRELAAREWVLPTYAEYEKANHVAELRIFGPEVVA